MSKLSAILFASLSVLASAHAVAASDSAPLTRADVIAEYQRARAAGELNSILGYSTAITTQPQQASTVTREQVRAEYLRAKSAGQLHNTGYETAALAPTAPASGLTRDDVRAEYLRARAAGELHIFESSANIANGGGYGAFTATDTKVQ